MALAEAESERKRGAQAMSTGLFKWKPDLLAAASAYGRAGDAFQRAMRSADAVECWITAADAASADGQLTSAAVNLGKAAKAMESMEGKDAQARASLLFEKVSGAYLKEPDLVRAAESMAKAARASACSGNGAEAERQYLAAADLFDAKPDRATYATKPLREGANQLVKLGFHKGAMAVYARLLVFYGRLGQHENQHSIVLSRVVLLLHAGDEVAARQEFEAGLSFEGFLHGRDGALADDLIAAYKSMDVKAIREVTSKRPFGYLDHSITTLARALKPEAHDELGGDDDGLTSTGGAAAAAAGTRSDAAADRRAAAMKAGKGQSAAGAAISGGGARKMEIEGLGMVTVTEFSGGAAAAAASSGDGGAASAKAEAEDRAARAALFAAPAKPAARTEPEDELDDDADDFNEHDSDLELDADDAALAASPDESAADDEPAAAADDEPAAAADDEPAAAADDEPAAAADDEPAAAADDEGDFDDDLL